MREVLADLRRNTKALSEYQKFFGANGPELEPVGKVRMEWRRKHVLAQAEIEITEGEIVDVESPVQRRNLEKSLSTFLQSEGINHLDIQRLRGKNRHITQRVSRALFEERQAGIKFHSHLDLKVCYALFEFRSRLAPNGIVVQLTKDVPELLDVCREFGLVLSP